MMKNKMAAALLLAGTLGLTIGSLQGQAGEAALQPLSHVIVHDPAIFRDIDGSYYLFGTHTATAKSEDLSNWQQIGIDYGSPENTPFYGNLKETLEKPFRWAGYDDGDCRGGYAVWAPVMIYNPDYVWEDGSTGAYMLYVSTSSTWRRSCISFLVSKSLDETFTFGDTLVYSGFTKTGEADNSDRSTKWDNDYLNLKELVDLGADQGGIDEVSENWFTSNGGWDHTYGPNAIDPTVFFDASGEKMYMVYGSWSGGIYLLELDPQTGEALYPGVDGTDEVSGNYVDRYFGVHLMGGNHASGEGPWITYDKETGYYYLYVTYGALQAEGGYNMRLFRSKDVTGPYVDAKGQNAAKNAEKLDDYGIKLMGNYSFYDQMGKRAAGHNSQLTQYGDVMNMDESASDDSVAAASTSDRFLIYHQRFDVKPQLEGHEVRVHQQFLNEDDWPVTAVYEYRGENICPYKEEEVVGAYEFIDHGTMTDGEMLPTGLVTLKEDGTITGSVEGTWVKKESGRGYDDVTMVIDGSTYKGVFFKQAKENKAGDEVMTFTLIGDNNHCLWGSGVDQDDPGMMLDIAAKILAEEMPKGTGEDLDLPQEAAGAAITWRSSDPQVISNEGKVTLPETKAKVVLTATMSYGGETKEQEFKILVRKGLSLKK